MIGSLVMRVSIWANVALALLSLCVCFVMVLAMSATPRCRDSRASAATTTGPNLSTRSQAGTLDNPLGDQEAYLAAADQSLVDLVRRRLVLFANYVSGISRPLGSGSAATLIWLGFVICPIRQILVFEILIPFATRRFGLKISEVR